MFSIQKMDLLIALYVACIVMAELMGTKTIHLFTIFGFPFNASVAIFLFPLVFTINDIIAEVHGKARIRSIAQSSLVIIFFLMCFSLFATWLPPSARSAGNEAAFDAIFQASARISAASLTAFIIAQLVDIAVFSRIKEKFGKKRLWLRNNLSNFVAQFIDTSVFMILAFYSFNQPFQTNAIFLIGLILPYWLLKCAASVIETPFAYLGVRWLKDER